MSSGERAGELSMDEILASIRKVIAEEPIGARGSMPELSAPRPPVAMTSAAESAARKAPIDDVLGLADAPVMKPASRAAGTGEPSWPFPTATTQKPAGATPVAAEAPAVRAPEPRRPFFPTPSAAMQSRGPDALSAARSPGASPAPSGGFSPADAKSDTAAAVESGATAKAADLGAVIPRRAPDTAAHVNGTAPEADRGSLSARLPDWLSRPQPGPGAPAVAAREPANAAQALSELTAGSPLGTGEAGRTPAAESRPQASAQLHSGTAKADVIVPPPPSATAATTAPPSAAEKAAEARAALIAPASAAAAAATRPAPTAPMQDPAAAKSVAPQPAAAPTVAAEPTTAKPVAASTTPAAKPVADAKTAPSVKAAPAATVAAQAGQGSPAPAPAAQPKPAAASPAAASAPAATPSAAKAPSPMNGANVPAAATARAASPAPTAPAQAASVPVPPPQRAVPVAETLPAVQKPTALPEKPKPAARAPAPAADPVAMAAQATGVRTLEDTVVDLLRPMLRQWLDDNMPRMVEKALRIELATSLQQKAKSDASKH
ncbi:MAG: DUF2497 domain-containing protein [Hyphomicrobiaceae bacterium]